MPTRSLHSSVLKWPDRDRVLTVFRAAAAALLEDSRVLGLGCYGSYARGDWGVGSDLDVVVIVAASERTRSSRRPSLGGDPDSPDDPDFQRDPDLAAFRSRARDALADVPVPVDVFVLTQRQWQKHRESGSRFYRTLREEALFLQDPDSELSSAHT